MTFMNTNSGFASFVFSILFLILIHYGLSGQQNGNQKGVINKIPEISKEKLHKLLEQADYTTYKLDYKTPADHWLKLVFVRHTDNGSFRLVEVSDGEIVANPYKNSCRSRSRNLRIRTHMENGKVVSASPTPVIRLGMTEECIQEIKPLPSKESAYIPQNQEYWLVSLNDKYLFPHPQLKGSNAQRMGPPVSFRTPDLSRTEGNTTYVPVVLPRKYHYVKNDGKVEKSDLAKKLEKKRKKRKHNQFELKVKGVQKVLREGKKDEEKSNYLISYLFDGMVIEQNIDPTRKQITLRDRKGRSLKPGGNLLVSELIGNELFLLAYKKGVKKTVKLTDGADFHWRKKKKVEKEIDLSDFNQLSRGDRKPKAFVVYTKIRDKQGNLQDKTGIHGPNGEVAVYLRILKRKTVSGTIKFVLPKGTYHFAIRYEEGPTKYLKKNVKLKE